MTLSCGHEATPRGIATGYAIKPNGERICYGCADEEARQEMRTHDDMFAYLSSDHRKVTTWTGGTLGTVTRYTQDSGRYYASGMVHRCYVRVTDVHGQHWYGSGPVENGDYVRLHRAKS